MTRLLHHGSHCHQGIDRLADHIPNLLRTADLHTIHIADVIRAGKLSFHALNQNHFLPFGKGRILTVDGLKGNGLHITILDPGCRADGQDHAVIGLCGKRKGDHIAGSALQLQPLQQLFHGLAVGMDLKLAVVIDHGNGLSALDGHLRGTCACLGYICIPTVQFHTCFIEDLCRIGCESGVYEHTASVVNIICIPSESRQRQKQHNAHNRYNQQNRADKSVCGLGKHVVYIRHGKFLLSVA